MLQNTNAFRALCGERLKMLVAIRIKDLKNGEYFTRKPIEYPTEKQVYVRGGYCRSDKKYYCFKWWDVCEEHPFKGETVVYTGFTF